jgi:2-hydroxy-3-keto-5-methylthiopentenyl-1-phosphate phosphatase
MPNIAIVWDFDKTLTPDDSTSQVIKILGYEGGEDAFWKRITKLTSHKKSKWEHVLGSHAPAWMYSLSQMAEDRGVPLDADFFKSTILPSVKLFPNAIKFLKTIKAIEKNEEFKSQKIKIYHFIVSAGLKDLVEQVFPKSLIKRTFGCRYEAVREIREDTERIQNIPVFCMDETMKTRSLFEISKGSFLYKNKPVNKRVQEKDRWAHFSDFIYVGDGPTDIPALSLTRYHGGIGIVVYNPKIKDTELKKKLKDMALDRRADLITAADYSLESELFHFIKARCIQIKQRYEAENFDQ